MRNKRFQIRLTEDELKIFHQKAKESGLSSADWARYTLLRKSDVDRKDIVLVRKRRNRLSEEIAKLNGIANKQGGMIKRFYTLLKNGDEKLSNDNNILKNLENNYLIILKEIRKLEQQHLSEDEQILLRKKSK